MPMRTLPVRLIRSQVDSVLDCARAGTALTAASVAAAMPAAAMSRRRIDMCAPLLDRLFVPLAAGPVPAQVKVLVPPDRDARRAPSPLRRRRLLQGLHRVVPDAIFVHLDAKSGRFRHDHAAVLDRERLG